MITATVVSSGRSVRITKNGNVFWVVHLPTGYDGGLWSIGLVSVSGPYALTDRRFRLNLTAKLRRSKK